MSRFNPLTWNFTSKRINEIYHRPHVSSDAARVETLAEVIQHFSDHFAKDNPNFDRKKFVHACIDKRD